jgi:hypothetical protein
MVLRFLLAAVLIPGLWIPSASAQGMPAGMKMHRLQAGEPDSSGWIVAKSTEGRFSVRLPLKFNDFTISETSSDEPVLRTFVVGTKSREGIKFTASRVIYRKGAESARYYFARMQNQDPPAVAERVTRHTVNRMQAADLVMNTPTHSGRMRVVLAEPDLLLMIVEFPHSEKITAEQFVKPFFDSLSIDTK